MKYAEVARWLQHDIDCPANDLDPLDSSPCTCGLRYFYDPKGLNSATSSKSVDNSIENETFSYRDYQIKLREDGWNAYNSDYVDEFPQW